MEDFMDLDIRCRAGPDEVEGVGDRLIVHVVFGEVDVDVIRRGADLVPDPAGDETHGPGALVVGHLVVVDDAVGIEGRVMDELLPEVERDVLTGAGLELHDRGVEVLLCGDGGGAEGRGVGRGRGVLAVGAAGEHGDGHGGQAEGGAGHGDSGYGVAGAGRSYPGKMKRERSAGHHQEYITRDSVNPERSNPSSSGVMTSQTLPPEVRVHIVGA